MLRERGRSRTVRDGEKPDGGTGIRLGSPGSKFEVLRAIHSAWTIRGSRRLMRLAMTMRPTRYLLVMGRPSS
jgi:hypothetical protein